MVNSLQTKYQIRVWYSVVLALFLWVIILSGFEKQYENRFEKKKRRLVITVEQYEYKQLCVDVCNCSREVKVKKNAVVDD